MSSDDTKFISRPTKSQPPPPRPINGLTSDQSIVWEHWKESIRQTVVRVGPTGIIQLSVQGGSDNGQFCYLGPLDDRVTLVEDGLKAGDILLDIQDQKVSGYTCRDVLALLNHSCRGGAGSIKITVAGEGLLTLNLRQFLNTRFVKGSPDHDLQNTIRDNLYLRTVPCTTRPRRDGEVDGVDYTFLSLNEFLALESSGNLLESGIYEGNHYGTPKPPRENHIHSLKGPNLYNGGITVTPPTSQAVLLTPPLSSQSISLVGGGVRCGHSAELYLPGAYPSSEGKRRRNRSNVEAMASKYADHDLRQSPAVSSVSVHSITNGDKSKSNIIGDSFGLSGSPHELGSLPENWEKAYTEEGEPYFINHTSGCSQWLDPRLARVQKKAIEDCDEDELPYGWEKIDDPQFGTYYIDHINRKTQYENPVLQARQAKNQQDETASQKPVFTKNPSELRGPLISTTLIKSPRGFGFTIVGGDEQTEEFLQIKSVIESGPAYQNGKLVQGDVLVYINDTCVLGYTHMDVVNVFQNIAVGEAVTLKVCRGYPLSFDVDDPHNEIVTTVAVTVPDDRQSVGRANSTEPSNDGGLFYGQNGDRGLVEVLVVGIVKGFMGFGFTIADSASGQKVKKILDRPRCKNLMEGDIMLEINSQDVRGLEHAQVVQYLKDCQQGVEAIITVQRGGVVLTNKTRPKSSMGKDGEETSDSKNEIINQLYSTNGPYRSKTPTCDVYGIREREVLIPNRPKTPLIDTRNLSITTTSSSSNHVTDINGRSKTPIIVPELNHRPATIGDALDTGSGSIYQKVSNDNRWTSSGDASIDERPHYGDLKRQTVDHYDEQFRHFDIKEHDYYNNNHENGLNPVGNRHNGGYYDGFYNGSSGDGFSNNRKEGTSFEHEQPSPISQSARVPYLTSWQGHGHGIGHGVSIGYNRRTTNAVSSSSCVPLESVESTMTLYRQENGFGFRIIGGTEEGSQVSIGHIVPGGAADLDGRLRSGDEITTVDGISVLHTSHHHVVQLMGSAAASGRVTLGVRRRVQLSDTAYAKPSESLYPYDVSVIRHENEGFGFVIISSITKAGSTIGRILDNSPAQRCGRLHIGDRILAVNGVDILNLHHGDIVNLIKDSGFTVTLTIGAPQDDASSTASMSQREETMLDEEQYFSVELLKGTRGFGFSIRGGKEFHNMPLFVLRIADSGPAAEDCRLQIGDQIIEINSINTKNMTHSEAIEIIKHGGSLVRLFVKRINKGFHSKDRYGLSQTFSVPTNLGVLMMPHFTNRNGGGPIRQSSPQVTVTMTGDSVAYGPWEYERGPV